MLILSFQGWYQCRLATDPDPTDEPWGITGGTFAGPGENPLDRIIRLQYPVNLRYPRTEDDFGVNVTAVTRTEHDAFGNETRTAVPDSPLIGAQVRLLGEPKYHQRNNILTMGLIAPIDPFIICVDTRTGIRIERRDEWDITRPGQTVDDVFLNPTLMAHRQQEMEINSPRLVEETGITDYAQFWVERRRLLAERLAETQDPTERAGLEKRIAFIDETDADIGTRVTARYFLGLLSTYTVDINGAAKIDVASEAPPIGGRIGTSQVWPIRFWMGSYDVDTLCGYMKGTLSLPFAAAQSSASGVVGPG